MNPRDSNRVPAVGAVTALLCAGLLVCQFGCVTERVPRALGTSPYIKGNPAPTSTANAPQAISQPAPGGLRFELAPLGEVPFDASVLPLVSPGGRFIAVQAGTAPPLHALNASGPAEALNTRIDIYDMSGRRLQQTFLAGPSPRRGVPRTLTQGMLLGRAVNAEGFLIEWPRQDATRWIGLCTWADASITWLVGGDESVATFAAHAILMHDGTLITALGDEEARGWLLAQRSPTGQITVLDADPATMLVPLSSLDARRFAYFRLDGDALTLNAAPVDADRRRKQLLDLGTARTVQDLTSAVASSLPPGSAAQEIFAVSDGSFGDFHAAATFLDPRTGQTASVWMDGSTPFTELSLGIVSAAPSRRGMLLTTRQDLLFVPRQTGIPKVPPGVGLNLMRKPGIVRGIWNGGFCVVEPGDAGSGALSVSKLTHPSHN